MTKFFVPFVDSQDQAERVYGVFVKNHGYSASPFSVHIPIQREAIAR